MSREALRLFAAVAGIPAPDLSDPAVAELAEQFALDVASVDDGQRTAFFAATGDQAFAVVQRIYAHDFVPRIRRVLPEAPAATPYDGDTWSLLESFMVEVARLSSLDPTLTELVRLRGARLHDCAVCKSRRSQDAIDAGADETLFAQVDHWPRSDLDATAKTALGVVDALVLGSAVPPEARTVLGDERFTEVALDVMRNAANKIAVALGADAATVTEGVELFTTDADGNLSVVGVRA